MDNLFSKEDYWRAIILYGLNTATYKIALGNSLIDFATQNKNNISMSELAESFFDQYLLRLESNKPQLLTPNRRTVMENIVDLYKLDKLTRTQAIAKVEREAFNDVIHRFHTVNNMVLPVTFYDYNQKGLILKDSLFQVFEKKHNSVLKEELLSRWDLLESAFQIRRENENSVLVNDIRRFYLDKGYERTNITKTRPVLNGYQNGTCFYCGEILSDDDIHVDHVIPRQVIQHDELWNLVLAHGFCNEQKSDFLPSIYQIEKLIARNEQLIASNNPLHKKLIEKIGLNPIKRRQYILKVYEDAKTVLGNTTWEGIRGYNPETDEFYKTYIRSMIK
jgi:5-methylcytosine-specific restriction endonuclease McrA